MNEFLNNKKGEGKSLVNHLTRCKNKSQKLCLRLTGAVNVSFRRYDMCQTDTFDLNINFTNTNIRKKC